MSLLLAMSGAGAHLDAVATLPIVTTAAENGTATPAATQTPVWEDIPDVFFQPAEVFARRRDGRYGKALLMLVILMTVLGAASTWALRPAQAADQARIMARVAQGNPEFQARMGAQGATSEPGVGTAVLGGVSTGVTVVVSIFLVGLAAWVLGRIFGSTASVEVAVMIATYAFFPRVLQQVAMTLQGLFLDPSSLDSMFRVTASPARFLEPDTASVITLMLLARLDLFVLWSTVLIGLGMYVAGRLSKLEAAAVAVLVWLVAALPTLIPAMLFA